MKPERRFCRVGSRVHFFRQPPAAEWGWRPIDDDTARNLIALFKDRARNSRGADREVYACYAAELESELAETIYFRGLQ